MIEILPLSNRERENEILNEIGAVSETSRVLMMADGGDEIGYAAVKITDTTLYFIKFHIENGESMVSFERDFYLDTLMRSGASYGENHGCDKMETVNGDYNEFLKKKGFETDQNHAFAPMSLIVHYE